MTTHEWNDRMIDELAARTRDDIAGLKQAQTEALTRTERMLEAIGQTCEKHTAAVQAEVREQGQEIRKLTAAQRWTPAQWAAILGPTLTALIGAVALILQKGTP
jgi:excinuclease UvrABC nuclease subunit